jgi:ribosome-associated toxin RatA of RatAB toxin-antitoxin module
LRIKTIPWLTVTCHAAALVSIATLLYAAGDIPLDEQQKKAISKGEIVVREVAAGKKGRTFEAIGLVKASRKIVAQVLTDYRTYPEFMPHVSSLEIVEQRGPEAVLDYTLTLPLGKIKKYRLRISARAPADKLTVLQWQLQKRPGLNPAETIADTTGYWRIEDAGEGRSLVLYHVYTDPGPVPFGLGWIVDVLSRKSVPEVLLQTSRRAERLSGNQQGN